MTIHKIIGEIANEAGALAPEKTGGVPFPFRGIDSTINHLAPLLNKHGVFSTSRITSKDTSTREIGNGKAITQSDLTMEFTFHAPDGSSVTTEVAGLAQDYADRSAAQAQSVAYRVALLQLFHLPTQTKEPEQAGEETQAEIAKAGGATPKPAEPKPDETAAIRKKIKAKLGVEDGDPKIKESAEAFAESVGKPLPKGYATNEPFLLGWLNHLETGEV